MYYPKKMENVYGFYWHAVFLALTKNFMNVNTIIPAVLLSVGGTEIHLGFLTAIMIGGSKLSQIFFGNFLSNRSQKKPYLLFGINVRVFSLAALAVTLQQSMAFIQNMVIFLIFVLITVFSLSGAFASVAYTDLLGKSIQQAKRKRFFVTKQTITSIGILFSALFVRKLLIIYPFPVNYSVLFYAASGLLLIASGGFWLLTEKAAINEEKRHHIFGKGENVITIIKNDSNLFYYLLLSNSISISIAIIPFYIALAKTSFRLTSQAIGNYLVFQIIGMIISNFCWMRIIKKTQTYKSILSVYILLNIFLPVYALITTHNHVFFGLVFFFTGFSLTAYEIVISGILVEISTNDNRALYTGISGTGNILSAIFPIISGVLVAQIGYVIVLLFSSLLISVGFVFAKRIHCPSKISVIS
jgi:MFS family permease